MSTALLDDALNGGESEAGAVADLLGGEEGLEDVALSFLVHALTVVAEGEADVLSVRQVHGEPRAAFDVGGFDGQPTARRHGIAGIDGEIDENLVHLPGIGENVPQAVGKRRMDLYVLSQQAGKHALGTGHIGVQVEANGLEDLSAAEGQQLAGERSGALRGGWSGRLNAVPTG